MAEPSRFSGRPDMPRRFHLMFHLRVTFPRVAVHSVGGVTDKRRGAKGVVVNGPEKQRAEAGTMAAGVGVCVAIAALVVVLSFLF